MKLNLISQLKWLSIALFITLVMVIQFESSALHVQNFYHSDKTFLGLNLFLEIFIFFAFGIFVVFGIKGFFELYSNKVSNVILTISGGILLIVLLMMIYQVAFAD